MNFQVHLAENGEPTLTINKKYIYSRYNPSHDAEKFILNEYSEESNGYFIIGLGLGYHLKTLIRLNNTKKKIVVLLLDPYELELFKKFSKSQHLLNLDYVSLINLNQINQAILSYQIIIPLSWLKAVGNEHRLFYFLEDIKVRQMSYESTAHLLLENFNKNIKHQDSSINIYKNVFFGKSACIVSAGPSLEYTIDLLGNIQKKCFVLCVGSALKVLLMNDIIPDAVIITDPTNLVIEQIKETNYEGVLFYLSTANHEMTLIHKGKRVIMLQQEYSFAEKNAFENKLDLLETGGSVATSAFSLLEYMGISKLFLFGQDLGFKGNNTHTSNSTSNKNFSNDIHFQEVMSNSNDVISTNSSYNIFRRWFERKATTTKMEVFNTSLYGSKIEGIPFLSDKYVEFFFESQPFSIFKL